MMTYTRFGPMFTHMRLLSVACVGLGLVLSFLLTSSSAWGKDLFTTLRSYRIQAVKAAEEAETSGGSAQSMRSLAKTHAEQKDSNKASTYFGHALKDAPPQQTPQIAADYAVFLLETGDLRKAELIIKQGLTQSPGDVELTRMLARCMVLQDRIIEGLRYFQSVSSDAEAKEAIAAIYREQGNTDMLAAVERKWGITGTPRPDVSSKPVLMAATPTHSPTSSPMLSPPVLPAKTTPSPAPALVTRSTPAVPSVEQTVPAVPSDVASATPTPTMPTPTTPPMGMSVLSSAKIPVPLPNVSSPPMTEIAKSATPALTEPASKLVTPMPPAGIRPVVEKREFANLASVKLPAAPTPVLAQSDTTLPARPETGMVKPRKHYVAEAGTSTDLDALFPIKPVTAVLPVKR